VSTLRVNDAELVERARRGDSRAFGELVDRYRAAVFRTALAACGSREDAEEIAQDAFVTAWRALTSFRGDAQFKTWLLAIAWKRALNRRRSIWVRLRRIANPSQVRAEPATTVGSPEQQLMNVEFTTRVARLVRTLPPKLRDPLLLMATGEWTYAQMAAAMKVSEGTLKWRVMEARRRLKGKLAAVGYLVK
jgi:RNA polymerase sigma-70 factor, ECF subfamily